jgi:pimeloyl-ACP methyl ester carboxylesterase
VEPETRYAKNSRGDSIAYQVVGGGPLDVLFVPGFVSHVELFWREPSSAHFFERLSTFSRLVLFDKQGTGLSDPLAGPQPLEERAEDMRAVMDASGVERAALVGLSEGSAMAIVFAATYPDRVSALVLCGSIMGGPTAGHPCPEKWERATSRFRSALENWGDGTTIPLVAPSLQATPAQIGMLERAGASPRMAQELIRMWLELDIRDVLPAVSVPTLVLHRTEEIFPVEAARELASRIPGARIVELPGIDHAPWTGDADAYLDEIAEFLTGVREHGRADRVLATVLVTDLVGSTARASELGDTAWRALMARHDELTRSQLRRFEGQEVKHTGDGFLATFDGPARAIRCARAIADSAPRELGLDVRAGVHTGEVEIVDGDLRGVAVHIAARVSALAGAGEVLVSSTVKELVMGSGLELADRGIQPLKGVEGEWRVYAVGARRAATSRYS